MPLMLARGTCELSSIQCMLLFYMQAWPDMLSMRCPSQVKLYREKDAGLDIDIEKIIYMI
jgi:hypothetical protein